MTYENLNPVVINVEDILTLIDKMKGKVSIPSFVAVNYKSLSPSNFEPLVVELYLKSGSTKTIEC